MDQRDRTVADTLESISVICTFFNAEDTLKATLNSLQSQTTAEAQFILVDDGSLDRSAAIAEEFCIRDTRFVLHMNPVWGRGRALNFAVAKARSEYVAILDADDLAHPDWLSDALAMMRHRLDFAAVGFERLIIRGDATPQWTESNQRVSVPALKDVTGELARVNPLTHSGTVIRRAQLVEVGCYDAHRRSLFDYDLWIRLAIAGNQLGRCASIRIAKRYHAGQKFAHSKGYFLSSLMSQCRAVLWLDRSCWNFVSLGLTAIRLFARFLKLRVKRKD